MQLDEYHVYFNYTRAPYFSSGWSFYFLAVFGICALITVLFINRSAFLLFLIVLTMLVYAYWILERKENTDKITEGRIVEDQLSEEIDKLQDVGRRRIVAKKYCVLTPKESYKKEKHFLLVVVSTGEVYRFGVDPAEKNGFILDKTATICKDKDELAFVESFTKHLRMGKAVKARRLMGIAAACIFVMGFAITAIAIWLGSKEWARVLGYVLLTDFVLSFVFMLALDRFQEKEGLMGRVHRVAVWNAQAWWLFFQLLLPSALLLIGMVFIMVFPCTFLLMVMKEVSALGCLTSQSSLFISLSLGTIISAHYSKPLFGWLSKVLKANGHRYEEFFQEMVEYVYQPANIEFLVNLAYVIYLVVSTVFRFQKGGAQLFGNDIDVAILESFLVFIAFSNMKKKRSSAKFSFPVLFAMIYGMWTTHDFMEKD